MQGEELYQQVTLPAPHQGEWRLQVLTNGRWHTLSEGKHYTKEPSTWLRVGTTYRIICADGLSTVFQVDEYGRIRSQDEATAK